MKIPYHWIAVGFVLGALIASAWIWALVAGVNKDTICFTKDIGEYLIRKELGI